MPAQTLPLFPLHTVLVPGYPLALHVFEDRYRRMISECLMESLPFGVCLIREGEEVGQPALPFEVGTVAGVAEAERLDDGRYNLLVFGEQRFRLEESLPPEPYPRGRVVLLPDAVPEPLDASTAAELTAMAEEYVRWLTKADATVHLVDTPTDAAGLSWLLMFLLQASMREKQALLEEDSATARLQCLRALYTRELSVMRSVDDGDGQALIRPLDADRRANRASPN